MSLVTVVFADAGGDQAYINLPWVDGKRLRHYLRDPTLRQYNLIGRSKRSRLMNQDRAKLGLNSVLAPGETVHVVPVRRAG